MQLPFVGHSKSCKNEKKSLVFSVNDLLSNFLFYLSLSLLIKIFLVFWFKNKTLLLASNCNDSSSWSQRPDYSDAWALRLAAFMADKYQLHEVERLQVTLTSLCPLFFTECRREERTEWGGAK